MCSLSQKPRWAIVSTGKISQDFAKVLQLSGSTVTCVSSRELATAQKFGAEHGIEHCFGSLDDMLAHAGELFDVCYIGTPHAHHAEEAIRCMRAGAHVLVEKPMAVNAAQVEQMLAVALETKRFLIEGMWWRFFPAARELRRLLLDERAIGPLRAVQTQYGFYPETAEDEPSRLTQLDDAGGALLDIGVYCLSAASLAFGGFEHCAFDHALHATALFGKTGCDALTSVALADKSGRSVQLVCSILAELPNEALYVGEKGNIVVHGPLNSPTKLVVTSNDPERRGESRTRIVELPIDGAAENEQRDAEQFNWPDSRGFQYEIRAVEQALERGALECAETPQQETLALARLMDQVREKIGLKYPSAVEAVPKKA